MYFVGQLKLLDGCYQYGGFTPWELVNPIGASQAKYGDIVVTVTD